MLWRCLAVAVLVLQMFVAIFVGFVHRVSEKKRQNCQNDRIM